jgi:hypothetical protein
MPVVTRSRPHPPVPRLTVADLEEHMQRRVPPGDMDAAVAAVTDAWAIVVTHIGHDPAPEESTTALHVAKRVAVRIFRNPLDRASYHGPEGLEFAQSAAVQSRLLTADEKLLLDASRVVEGFG